MVQSYVLTADTSTYASPQDMIWYGHKNGMIPDDDFNLLWNTCGARHPSSLTKGRWGNLDRPQAVMPKEMAVERERFSMGIVKMLETFLSRWQEK